MTLTRTGLALTLSACTLPCITVAQTATFTDPANLRGERVRPSDGRELPVDQGASGLQQLLRKLNTRASLMLIVAHPDDEDGGMLTLYSRGLGARVAVLTLNRGEGGQNAMTGDFEDALGLLRTQELLSADRYFDVDQMFGTEVDFGFSKTKEESFAKWTHQRVLYDAVRAVRLYRPLVIASVFVGGVTDGHGQHQVSGEIAQEVFNAAGDPKVFPELTAEGILPWQPLKVYARVPMQSITPQGLFDYATGQYTPAKFTNYVTGEVTTTEPSVDVVVHEGTTDPLLDGKSYVQFARIGLGLQRSQIGPGVRNAPPGAFDISYHRYGSRLAQHPPHEESFFDGVDTNIEGIATLATNPPIPLRERLQKISLQIDSATKHLNPANLSSIAPQLAEALSEITALISATEESTFANRTEQANVLHELRIKRVQLNNALAIALGLAFDSTTKGANQTVGSSFLVLAEIREHGANVPLNVANEWLQNSASSPEPPAAQDTPDPKTSERSHDLNSDHPYIRTLHVTRREAAIVTRPYFFRDSIETPVYSLRDPSLRNAPTSMPAFTAWAVVDFRGVPIQLAHIVHDGAQPLSIVPEDSIMLSHAQVLANDKPQGSFVTHLTPIKNPPATPHITAPPGWKVEAVTVATSAPPLGDTFFTIHPPAGLRSVATFKASVATTTGETITEGYYPVGYGDLPRTNYFTPATIRIVPVDLKLSEHHRIAYLPGTGDDVPAALTSIGLTPTILTIADLTPAKLAAYDTVILGVRTYNAHPDLHGAPTQALLDYARNGGNVVVQYQTAEFTAADAPYPLSLGNAEKVVDETTPVQLLEPANPLLTTPNKITPGDFNNWIEERGHGFLRTWDSHYTALTETHDPGGPETQAQAPQLGGLITTPLGKGRWTYCAFALYRQLPEAVPGAYRLFANLINP